MPSKGVFTQGMVILLRGVVPLRAIEKRLAGFQIVKRNQTSGDWPFGGGPSVLVAYRPGVNGHVLVEMIEHCWPDHMGDPKTDPEVFAAWGMGYFGPGTWPGALERACQYARAWPEASAVVPQHGAFIRVLCSYGLGAQGAKPDAPVMPPFYKPFPELEFMTRIAAALVKLPEVLCYFNPNGECIQRPGEFADTLSQFASVKLMPLPLWCNTRFFTISDLQPPWDFMDTVGMMQLDAPDHEACFESGAYAPEDINVLLMNASAYPVQNGSVMRDGAVMEDGGVKWRAFSVKEGLMAPPRPTIRWFPQDGRKVPPGFTAAIAREH